jgi:hypothetical protein
MAKHELLQGIKLFEDFNREEPHYIDKIYIPDFSELIFVGPCLDISYHARDGHDYRHEFRKKSRPDLCVTPDGLQLVLIGGNYQFTGRGITDL